MTALTPSCVSSKFFSNFQQQVQPTPGASIDFNAASTNEPTFRSLLTSPMVSPSVQPRGVISLQRAIGDFALGLTAAFGGRAALKAFRGKAPKEALTQAKTEPLEAAAKETVVEAAQKEKTYYNFRNPLLVLYAMALEEPKMLSTLATYGGVAAFGYVFKTFFEGIQQKVVRQGETDIRRRAIEQLKGAYRQGIQLKQQIDAENTKAARQGIQQILREQGFSPNDIQRLMPSNLGMNPNAAEKLRNFVSEPTHLKVTTQPVFGFSSGVSSAPDAHFLLLNTVPTTPTPQPPNGWDALFVGAGLATGLLIQEAGRVVSAFGRAFKGYAKQLNIETNAKQVEKSFFLNDGEALVALSQKIRKHQLPLLLGYGALAGLAVVGKLFVDGLQEIWVTAMNADTEVKFEEDNRTQLDPGFHKEAVEAAMKNELRLLKQGMQTRTLNDPKAIAQRIQQILTNTAEGLNAPPKFFLSTPPISIVEGRVRR